MRFRELDIDVSDSLFDPRTKSKTIQFREPSSGSPLYCVHLFLTGDDLPYVKRATYLLHPTFHDRVRVVERTVQNPNCVLQIWTWGLFEVEVRIEDKFDNVTVRKHNLTYAREIEETPADRFKKVS